MDDEKDRALQERLKFYQQKYGKKDLAADDTDEEDSKDDEDREAIHVDVRQSSNKIEVARNMESFVEPQPEVLKEQRSSPQSKPSINVNNDASIELNDKTEADDM